MSRLSEQAPRQVRALTNGALHQARKALVADYWAAFYDHTPGSDEERRAAEKLVALGAVSAKEIDRLMKERDEEHRRKIFVEERR